MLREERSRSPSSGAGTTLPRRQGPSTSSESPTRPPGDVAPKSDAYKEYYAGKS